MLVRSNLKSILPASTLDKSRRSLIMPDSLVTFLFAMLRNLSIIELTSPALPLRQISSEFLIAVRGVLNS